MSPSKVYPCNLKSRTDPDTIYQSHIMGIYKVVRHPDVQLSAIHLGAVASRNGLCK